MPAGQTITTIKSSTTKGGGGSNELRFDDKKGLKEILLHGQRDWRTVVEHDQNETVGNNTTVKVGGHRVETVGKAQTLAIGTSFQVTVGTAMNETIGSDKQVQVGGTVSAAIGKDLKLTVGGDGRLLIGKNFATAALLFCAVGTNKKQKPKYSARGVLTSIPTFADRATPLAGPHVLGT